MFDYPVILEPDGDTVLVTFPDVPEAVTFGADEQEALLQAVDALETALSLYIDARKPLPVPSDSLGGPTVRPSALESAKLGVYVAMTEQGVRKAELARRLGWHMPQVADYYPHWTRTCRQVQVAPGRVKRNPARRAARGWRDWCWRAWGVRTVEGSTLKRPAASNPSTPTRGARQRLLTARGRRGDRGEEGPA